MIVESGLGTIPTSSIISSGIATAGGTLAIPAIATPLLAMIGLSASWVPFVGPIVGGVALAVSALGIGNGCGPTCTASTSVVNEIEPYMKQNVQAARDQASANGGCLTGGEVKALTDNFNQLWGYVTDNCNKVGGVGGKQCIADRQRGGKWDWFVYYLDPIMAIPICASAPASSVMSAFTNSSGGTDWTKILAIGLVGLGLVGLVSSGGKG